MAKTREEDDPENPGWWTYAVHIGPGSEDVFEDFHTIYWAEGPFVPINSWATWKATEAEAINLARHLARNPALLSDVCPACHYYARRPTRPRMNIYRGEEYPYRTPGCVTDLWQWVWN